MQSVTAEHLSGRIVILADGKFPTHSIPLFLLRSAKNIICCDGSAEKLINEGLIPNTIVGDMDSLPEALQTKYASIIHRECDQEYNDLTKAVLFAIKQNPSYIYIVGATGLRDDHTIGNISLLSYYKTLTDIPIELYTDTGKFRPITTGATFDAPIGSKISIFSLDTDLRIISEGLRYPLDEVIFDSWWKATLNQTTADSFKLIFESGRVILYLNYPPHHSE